MSQTGVEKTTLAAGGFAALLASICCLGPLLLVSVGVSGAWIGNLTQIAPYQPYIIGATLAFLGGGYWLVHRSSQAACADGDVCSRKLPSRLVKSGLVLATLLVVAALGFDFVAPLLLD